MYIDENEIWHVMMFCSINSDIMLLVYNVGTNYAKYVSIISNGGERIEKKFTTRDRYKKVVDEIQPLLVIFFAYSVIFI